MSDSPTINMQKRQEQQHIHDVQNHFDIVSLSRIERLKHYGLHYAKYAGRFARGANEAKSRKETIVDALLVVLSAANALNQALPEINLYNALVLDDLDFTERAGRFADACEKIDHLEEFRNTALKANIDILECLITFARAEEINIDSSISDRRRMLASRVVYTAG